MISFRTAFAALFLFPVSLYAGGQSSLASAVNVNSRYIVEQVEIEGYPSAKLSDSLRLRLGRLPGTAYDTETLDQLSSVIRKDLHAKAVTQHLARGSSPERVKVIFEVERRSVGLDVSVPKFLYHSKQGFSAQVVASTTIARNHTIVFGLVSDGDEHIERFTGIQTGYENTHVGTDRLRFRFTVEDYHLQWNRTTVSTDVYRTRQNYEPALTFALTPNLFVTSGLSFERMNLALPMERVEGANAFTAGLLYRQKFPDENGSRAAEAAYNVRIASHALGSDYLYTRHHWTAGYNITRGRHSVSDQVTAGYIAGRAPLFERFVLGTSSLLRGWNRYDIDPLGGNRLIHNSVEYRYRMANVFYDTGSLWSFGKVPSLKHSLGAGIRYSIFSVALAFPLRQGRVEPLFMVGMNY